MVTHEPSGGLRLTLTAAMLFVSLTVFLSGTAHSHGGKTHTDEPFSAFQAVQKAVALYDRLIVSKKLEEAWETDLTLIQVEIRGLENSREYVVQFKRATGDPDSVFFYFDRQGEYSGSNFTGK